MAILSFWQPKPRPTYALTDLPPQALSYYLQAINSPKHISSLFSRLPKRSSSAAATVSSIVSTTKLHWFWIPNPILCTTPPCFCYVASRPILSLSYHHCAKSSGQLQMQFRPSTCDALIDYVPPNNTTFSAIQTFFGITVPSHLINHFEMSSASQLMHDQTTRFRNLIPFLFLKYSLQTRIASTIFPNTHFVSIQSPPIMSRPKFRPTQNLALDPRLKGLPLRVPPNPS